MPLLNISTTHLHQRPYDFPRFWDTLGYPVLDPVGCQNTTDVEMGQGEVFWALQHQIEPLARLWPGCSWETWHFMFFGPWDSSRAWGKKTSKWTWLDVAGKPHSPWSLYSHLISEKIESMGIFHCHGWLPEGIYGNISWDIDIGCNRDLDRLDGISMD